jgi:predicted AAA+ superfamily ATPase
LVENFVFQEIRQSLTPYYWSNENKAEIDLIVEYNDNIYPIEVKSGINLKAKSLKIYDKLFSPNLLIRASLSKFNREAKIMDIPLYALSSIFTD